jgi:thioredoxin 1
MEVNTMKVVENIEEFDQILADNTSVFVDFFADWCGPCKMVGPVVEGLAAKHPDITFVKVNVDDVPELAQRYGIMSIPALFAFKNGEVAANTLGFKPEAALERIVLQAK